MSVWSATRTGSTGTPQRRAPKPSYDPLKERAKLVADQLWERAVAVAKVLAPDVPADQEPLPEWDQWMVLERVAMQLSPAAWNDANAIEDLFKLRKLFAPQMAEEWMPIAAKYRRKEQAGLPDPAVSPASPEFEKNMRRLSR